jgi:2',3'-cyclic-nucleotide 2'-phosphodiesterase (5'-nucleotidase family)
MGRLLLLWLLLFTCFTSICSADGTDGQNNELVIVYTSGTNGYVEPSGCCVKRGGLARRAGMIHKIKSEHPNTLILDGGDTFHAKIDFPEKRAKTVMQGMKLMGYDVINIGDGEFSLGLEFFDTQRRQWGLNFVSATASFKEVVPKEAVKSWVIEKRGGIRIGIIGIMSKALLDENQPKDERVSIGDPAMSLKNALTGMRGKTNINILLSHLGYGDTKNLLMENPVPGLDVVIVGHGRGILPQTETLNNFLTVQCSLGGEYLGVLTLSLDNKKKIVGHNNQMIALTLSADIPEDVEAKKIMDSFVNEINEENGRIKSDASDGRARKAQSELLKMTPEEFIKLMQKENEEKAKPGQLLPATVPLK